MKRNFVQFLNGLSITAFLKHYGTEQQCFNAVFKIRWPNGFICPKCGHDKLCQLNTRKLQQCNNCHRQNSIIAGTIFDSTNLFLTAWIFVHLSSDSIKKGIPAMRLHRQLGIGYNAAWRMKHKLMHVMAKRNEKQRLSGLIQIDDVFLGGERRGGKRGRGASGKTSFVAAVQTNDLGHPQRLKVSVVKGFRKTELKKWAALLLQPGTQVVSDGLACFKAVTASGYSH